MCEIFNLKNVNVLSSGISGNTVRCCSSGDKASVLRYVFYVLLENRGQSSENEHYNRVNRIRWRRVLYCMKNAFPAIGEYQCLTYQNIEDAKLLKGWIKCYMSTYELGGRKQKC